MACGFARIGILLKRRASFSQPSWFLEDWSVAAAQQEWIRFRYGSFTSATRPLHPSAHLFSTSSGLDAGGKEDLDHATFLDASTPDGNNDISSDSTRKSESWEKRKSFVQPGTIYFVSTPIGNLDDITLRAIKVLREADVIAAEDTRRTGKLLELLGIPAQGRLVAHHEHNWKRRVPELLRRATEGCSIAVVSDAGTPGIADPGQQLAAAAAAAAMTGAGKARPRGLLDTRGAIGEAKSKETGADTSSMPAETTLVASSASFSAAKKKGGSPPRSCGLSIPVVPVPGPCAAVAALSVSGFPSGEFVFFGFLPRKGTEKRSKIAEMVRERRVCIFYEAPHRIVDTMNQIESAMLTLGAKKEPGRERGTVRGEEEEKQEEERAVLVSRELTKKHEELFRGSVKDAALWLNTGRQTGHPSTVVRGEFTVVLGPRSAGAVATEGARHFAGALQAALADVAALMAGGPPASEVHQRLWSEGGVGGGGGGGGGEGGGGEEELCLSSLPMSAAVKRVADAWGVPRKKLYQAALQSLVKEDQIESALSIFLEDYATSLSRREQYAVTEFAQALLVIPKTLSVNAAQGATELVAALRAEHNEAQTDPNAPESKKCMGLDLIEGVVRNNLEVGVVEPAISKIKSLRFATETAITILRIDDMIKLSPPQQQQG